MDFPRAFAANDRFEIRRLLGSGGMGMVYEAYDRDVGAPVALKTIRDADPEALYRLKREFRALQGIVHPNLVNLGELFESEGTWFFTMELIDGVDILRWVGQSSDDSPTADISNIVAEHGAAPQNRVDHGRLRKALRQIVSGLQALHSAGHVHRDIKPSNVLVTRDGRVVVLDFGLVTAVVGHDHTSGRVVGTVAYMAPEQAASTTIGPGADWYSVGVLLYQALTGRLPFVGRAIDVLQMKQSSEPEPPSRVNDTIPEELDRLCVRLLRTDPANRPSGSEIMAILGGEADRVIAALPPSADRALFVGRNEEVAHLRAAFAQSQGGSAVGICVYGKSGVGKTALLQWFTDQLKTKEPNVVVLSDRCYEREVAHYKAFDSLVDQLADFLASLDSTSAATLIPPNVSLLSRLFPVLLRVEPVAAAPTPRKKAADPLELRVRALRALREMLTLVAERYSLVLWVDDLQWADADSFVLLHELVRPPDPPPVLLLLSSRVSFKRIAAPHIEDRETIEWIDDWRLGPLGRQPALELANRLLRRAGIESAISADRVIEEARRQPIFIEEIIRHAAETGNIGELTVLEDAIRGRASVLSEIAIQTLQVLSLATIPLSEESLATAVGLDRGQVERHLAVLRAARFAKTSTRRGVGFAEPYHDQIRAAIARSVDPESTQRWHRRIAHALQGAGSAGADSCALVLHFERAGDVARAAHHAERAAEEAFDAFAFDLASQLYEDALRLGEHDSEQARELRTRLAESYVNAGRGALAADQYLQCAERADRSTNLKCRARAVENFLVSGHIEQGFQEADSLLMDINMKAPQSRRGMVASLLWNRLMLRLGGLRWTERRIDEISTDDLLQLEVCRALGTLGMVDPLRGAEFHSRALRLALRIGEPALLARAIAHEAAYRSAEGEPGLRCANRWFRVASEIAKRSGDPAVVSFVEATEAFACFLDSRLADSMERAVRAEETLKAVPGATWELSTVRSVQMWVLDWMGRFSELRGFYRRCQADAARRRDRYFESRTCEYTSLMWLCRDEPARVVEDVQRITWSEPDDVLPLLHFNTLRARTHVALYTGGEDDSLDELCAGFRVVEGLMPKRVQHPWAWALWLRGNLLLGAADVASTEKRVSEADRLARRLARRKAPYCRLFSSLLHAGVASRRGEEADAAQAFRTAADVAADHEFRFYEAAALFWLAELIGGDQGQAALAGAQRWADTENVVNIRRLARIAVPGLGREHTYRCQMG